MKLDKLIIMQEELRDIGQVWRMLNFVDKGGIFDKKALSEYGSSSIIKISRFPDGKHYIHDGHHRVVAIFLSKNRNALLPTEYKVRNWTYEEYQEINLERKWVTPFDPRKEVRRCCFVGFKKLAISMFKFGEDMGNLFIRENYFLYCKPRTKLNVGTLVPPNFSLHKPSIG